MRFGIHHSDMDGIASKIVMHLDCCVPEENLIMVDYPVENIDKEVRNCINKIKDSKSPGELYIADICPSDDVCDEIDEAIYDGILSKVVLGDHHKTRAHLADKYDWFYFDNNLCGAQVFAKAIGTEDMYGKFLEIVGIYDLYKVDNVLWNDAYRLNKLCYAVGDKLFFKTLIYYNFSDDNHNYSSAIKFYGDELVENTIEKDNKFVEEAIDRCRIDTDENGNIFAWIVGVHGMTNDVAHAVLKKFYIDYFASVDFSFGVSLRSNGFDVGKIAKSRGGGGHRESAAYPLPSCWHSMPVIKIVGGKL